MKMWNMVLKNNILKRFIAFILIAFSGNLIASEVLYNRKEQAGLLFLYVSDIVKDQKGYLWLGTYRGLNRWDGYNYKYYLSDKNDSTSVSSNKIQSLLIDKDQFIWVATPNGLNRFNPKDETFTHFFHDPFNSRTISSNNINCLCEDNYGNIIVGTNKGLNIYNKSTNTFQFIDVSKMINNPTENYSNIRSLFCDSENNIWIGFMVSGILKINTNNLEHSFYLKDNLNNFINSVNDIVEVDKNTLLLATWGNKVFSFSKKDNTIIPWKGNKYLNSNVTDFITIDNRGNLWIADHFNQILNITPELKIINSYSASSELNKIPSNQIASFYMEDDNVWFGTYNQGFFHIRNSINKINDLSRQSIILNQLSKISVTALTSDQSGNLFIGTSNHELFIYNESAGSLKRIHVSIDIITRLFYDSFHNRLYLGAYSSQLRYIDLKTFEEKVFVNYASNFTIMNFESNKNKLFVALWGHGIHIINEEGSVKFLGKNSWEMTFSALNMTFEDSILWLATYDFGLVSYNLRTNKFESHLFKGETGSLFPSNQINLIKCLKNGKLLVSSNELGLCYFDKINNEYKPVGVEIGINNVHIKSIIEDNHNNIWIISEQKIIKTNEKFDSQTSYTLFDGLNFGIEHLAATYNSLSEKIYFGGQEGVQYLNTNILVTDSSSSNVVITDFKIFEKPIPRESKILNGKSISYTDSITLSNNENIITITFSAMHFYEQNNNLFSYKLEGVNTDWITVPYTQNSVTYSNLSPGEYNFLIKSTNNHGAWSENITRLHISITPPFWRTSWFRLMIIALIIAIVWGYVKIKEFNYLKEKKKLELIVSERTAEIVVKNEKLEIQTEELLKANDVKNKFFNIIAHDLKNPVSSIVQLIELEKENFDVFSREQQLEILQSTANSANTTLELLDDLLLWARSQTNKITFQFEQLNINNIAKIEINNLFQQAINKQITIKNNLLHNVCVIADISSVKTIFRNLLSNAIKFSNKGDNIKIGCHIKENDLLIYIKDTGIGMSESTLQKLFVLSEKQSIEGTSGEKGSGLGLNLCQEFIIKNGGEIWAESELNVGSTFYFTLPLCFKAI
jgi:signal transduction histidine kinase/ligand-binding sensor domain-containing protein